MYPPPLFIKLFLLTSSSQPTRGTLSASYFADSNQQRLDITPGYA